MPIGSLMNSQTLLCRLCGVALVVAAAVFLGCAPTGRTSRLEKELPPGYADSLYSLVKQDYASGDLEAAEEKAREMVHAYPSDPRLDEVQVLAARASLALENYGQAARYAAAVLDGYPMSPGRGEALLIAAEANDKLGNYYESANALCSLLQEPIDADTRNRSLSLLRDLAANKLSVPDLERLIDDYPSSELAAEMSLGLARREFARGNYDRAYSLLTDMLYEFPDHSNAPEVRQLLKLTTSRRTTGDKGLDYVVPNKIGIILPQTGNMSRFGRYFEQGIGLALDDYTAASQTPVSFVTADSKGTPVDAVNAVRKLVYEEGCVALIGAVFSVPSIAAAIEANALRVPMISPVATEHGIDELGRWIFQTRVPKEVEVTAISRVAVEDLLLERFAILAPGSAEGQKLADLFAQEVTRLGGEVVASQQYKPGDTDFKDQLEVIREAAPEAMFIPGDTEELLLLIPQITFYDLQVQLLGLSNWNSERLLRLSERELEGALFPNEAYHGKDPHTYQQFVARYTEKYKSEAHPVAVAGYFGARLLLEALYQGAIDREQVRAFLDTQLNAGLEQRMQEANTLSILKVKSGKVREFNAYVKNR